MGWGLDNITNEEARADRKKEFNNRQRSLMKSIGENMASLGCVLIILMFVGYIWTDMKIQIFSERMLCDAIVSVVSFILLENLMAQNGIKCGQLYDAYISTREAYIELRDRVVKLGVSHMNAFCDRQIEQEYEYYIRKRCRELKVDYLIYSGKYCNMTLEELKSCTSADLAVKIFALRQIEPIELSPEMLMTDDTGEMTGRGGLGMSAQEYLKKKTRGAFNVITTVVTSFVSASIAFMANEGASWGLVMYTLLKLALLCWRMYKGYSSGAKAYNTIEVKHLEDKMLYLNLYVEFLTSKRYLDIEDQYEIKEETNEFESSNCGGGRAEDKFDRGRAKDAVGA